MAARNIVRSTFDRIVAEGIRLAALFPPMAWPVGERAGTAFVYAAGPASRHPTTIASEFGEALPFNAEQVEAVARILRSSGRFDQVMLVVDMATDEPPDLAAAPATPGGSAPLLAILRQNGSTPTGASSAGALLPMTRAVIRAIEANVSGGPMAADALTPFFGLSGSRARVLVDGRFVLTPVAGNAHPADRSWLEHFANGVDDANRREPGTGASALVSYERALAMRPDTPDPDQYARLIVYHASMLKRLGRLTEAETHLTDNRDLWVGTEAEVDASYNLACLYAMRGERELMLRSLEATGGSPVVLHMVTSHLTDYFAGYAKDPALLDFLSGRTPTPRASTQAVRADFYAAEEILDLVATSERLDKGERPLAQLRILATARQNTWLVVTARSLVFVLDDAGTRRDGRLIQRVTPLEKVVPVRASVDSNRIASVSFGAGDGRTAWFYSPALFDTPAVLEAEIAALLATASHRPVLPTRQAERERAYSAAVNLDPAPSPPTGHGLRASPKGASRTP